MRSESGEPVPADIEFAFRNQKLALLQMRPFVESKGARSNAYLIGLDAGFKRRGSQRVKLNGVPKD
jgi:hypothetical protein